MAQHVHFDVDQLERSIRAAFTDTMAEALIEIERQGLGPESNGYVEAQLRAVEATIALARWYGEEFNRGTPAVTIFGAAGVTIGRMLAEMNLNVTTDEERIALIGSFQDAASLSDENAVGLEKRTVYATQGGRA